MSQTDNLANLVLINWDTRIKQVDKLLSEFSEADFFEEIAPGKNRVIYILGHLVAVHDELIFGFGFGQIAYPELKPVFLGVPDDKTSSKYSGEQMMTYWKAVNDRLGKAISELSSEQWFEKHAYVSEADFLNEPNRNKMNLLLSRLTHLAYHHGQLILAKRSGG